jgi:hypothetical protein
VRRVKAGEFIVVNPHLLQDLTARGLWTPAVRHSLVAESGSIQNIPGIPEDLKEIYRTVWEVKQKALIDMAADRGAYIDQSQSLNAFMAEPDYNRLTSMHFYAWKKGLKTGAWLHASGLVLWVVGGGAGGRGCRKAMLSFCTHIHIIFFSLHAHRYVLPPHQARRQRHPVHRRPLRVAPEQQKGQGRRQQWRG